MAMSDQHKAALAAGRRETAAIKRYLEALEKKRPGRPVTLANLQERAAEILRRIEEEPDRLKVVGLIQARMDTEARIGSFEEIDFAALEAQFVQYVSSYSQRKGISYSAWREMGVPAALLKQADIPRTRRS